MAIETIALPPSNWQRAILRGKGLPVTPITKDQFLVPSTSKVETYAHIVRLDGQGRIAACSNCPGWSAGGRQNPCKHAGAVARYLRPEIARKIYRQAAASAQDDHRKAVTRLSVVA